jgi:hypothetical protein
LRPRARFVVAASAGLASATFLALGCALIAGVDGERHLADVVDASDDTTQSVDAGCTHATFPDPPTSGMSGGNIEITSALRSFNLGELSDAGPTIGLDLDLKCTCEGQGPSCRKPDWIKSDAGTASCDLADGRDNAAQRVFSLFTAALGGTTQFGSIHFSDQANTGVWSLLFRVRGYNGLPDDDQVELALIPAANLGSAPKWDGTDAWPIFPYAFEGDATNMPDVDKPLYVDKNAYVTNNQLVGSLQKSGVLIGGNNTRVIITLTAGVLTGTIVKHGGAFSLDQGVLAARWKISDVFASIGSYRSPTGDPFCTDTAYYQFAKGLLCSYVDINSVLGTPTDPCDAISFGLAFTAQPAKVGAFAADPMPPSQSCSPGHDPTDDACDKK